MTKLEAVWVLEHFEWYTHDKDNGYQPTEKAPPEAIEALKEINEYNLRKYGKL